MVTGDVGDVACHHALAAGVETIGADDPDLRAALELLDLALG